MIFNFSLATPMRLFSLTLLAMLSSAAIAAPSASPNASATSAAPAFVLEGTQVRPIPSSILKRDYEIFVSLPKSYASSQKSYPVLFVTDANYAFPLIRAITQRISGHSDALQEYILIGLSYAKGDTPTASRNRDYTPSHDAKDYPAGEYGQAEQYRQFLLNEVFPFVAKNYRADMQRKVFSGHSYGGLFGMHVLFNSPEMFQAYILGSPSLWFDKRAIFAHERAYAAKHKDLPAKVWLYTGEYETVRRGQRRYNQELDLVKDMQEMEKQLKARKYPNLTVKAQVMQEEDHLTVFPSLITRGLMGALGNK